jgi:hypothetical protein
MFFNEAQSLNALSSIETTPSGKIISCKDEHPENAPDSIFLTLVGIVMCFKEEQFANVLLAIVLIPLGKTISVKPEHPKKASLPISLMVDGIVTLLSEVVPWKAFG